MEQEEAPGSDDEEEEYVGARDSNGKYHGRGTLTYLSSNVRYEGRFCHGEKNGKGTMHFVDEECVTGMWKSDSLHGPAVYRFADGSTLVGNYVEGELEGTVREFASDGQLRFEGQYEHGNKHGRGMEFLEPLPHSGFIEGNWMNGVLSGEATYHYPYGGFCLKGTWKNGDMERAKFYMPNSSKPLKGTFSFDPSTDKRISSSPMQPDLYEQQLVYVKRSNVSGEGLFAKVNIPAGVIVAFYNGIRITHREVDRRRWEVNNNTISLDEETVIDVPAEWSSCSKYCASLGHKSNHSFNSNAKYDICFHPRFGNIKCVRTIADLRKDEEILADYGYTNSTPKWYKIEKKRFHDQQS